MALPDEWRAIANPIRAIPGIMGLRPHSVTILDGTWDGPTGHTGDGDETTTSRPVLEQGQNPKVRWLTDEEVALGSSVTAGSIEIGPITPQYAFGGTSLDDFNGTNIDTGDTLHILVTGPKHPNGARYAVVEVRADRAIQYILRCKPA